MRRKAWVTHAATPDLVFSEPASTLWRRIIAKKGWVYRLMAEGPDDLSTN
jgi:putative AlgH/UPF0301 family transcriptional regulator